MKQVLCRTALVTLFLSSIALFESGEVFARRKASKGKARRSAGSSRRRSAGSGRRRHSATKVSRFSNNNAGTNSNNGVNTTSASSDKAKLPMCPLGKILWRNPDDDPEGVFYKSKSEKSKCSVPVNVLENPWNTPAIKDVYKNKPAFMLDEDAVVLTCEKGYLPVSSKKKKKKNDDIANNNTNTKPESPCVSEEEFCILDEIVEKKSKDGKAVYYFYGDDENARECRLVKNSIAKRVDKEDAVDAGFDEDDVKRAYKIICNKGYYSSQLEGSSLRLDCKKCPEGKTTAESGANALSECIPDGTEKEKEDHQRKAGSSTRNS